MAIKKVYSKRQKAHVWGFDVWVGGRRKRDFAFATKREAEDAEAALKLAARADKYGLARERVKITVADLVEARAAALLAAEKEGKDWNRRRAVKVLRAWLKTLPAGLAVVEVKTAHVSKYLEQRRPHLKQWSLIHELSHIRSCLSSAPNHFPGLQDYQPPKMPSLPAPRRGRERVLEPEELEKIQAQLRAPWPRASARDCKRRAVLADFLEFLVLTGMRQGEAGRLRQADVNLRWHTARVEATKTDTVRTVHLNARAEEIVRRQLEGNQTDWVWPNEQGTGSYKIHRTVLKKWCKRAGVVYGNNVAGGFVPHDSRHTSATEMLRAGADLPTVGAVLGHSDMTMTMRYGHTSPTQQRAAIDRLAEYGVHLESKVRLNDRPLTESQSGQSEAEALRKTS